MFRGYRCALSHSLWLLSLQVESVIHPSARRAAQSSVSQLYKYTSHAKSDAEGALLSKWNYLTSVFTWVFYLSTSNSESPVRSLRSFFITAHPGAFSWSGLACRSSAILKHKVDWLRVGGGGYVTLLYVHR